MKQDDEDLLKQFYEDIGCDRNISYLYNKQYKKYYAFVYVQHPHLSNTLIKQGVMQDKSFKIRFPNNNIVPEKLLRHFIRGYFDGDGGISKAHPYHKISYSITGNYEFIDEMRRYISKEIGNNVPMQKSNGSNVYILAQGGTNVVQTFLDWIYKDSTIYMKRKHDLYIELLKYNKEKRYGKNKTNQTNSRPA